MEAPKREITSLEELGKRRSSKMLSLEERADMRNMRSMDDIAAQKETRHEELDKRQQLRAEKIKTMDDVKRETEARVKVTENQQKQRAERMRSTSLTPASAPKVAPAPAQEEVRQEKLVPRRPSPPPQHNVWQCIFPWCDR